MPEFLKNNYDAKVNDGELQYRDRMEEKISLSDGFGLQISFYQGNQDDFFDIVDNYFIDYETTAQ